MKIVHNAIGGCYSIYPEIGKDKRGRFVKTFHKDIFAGLGLETSFSEDYYSASKKGVLRGLHFQIPPREYSKLVYCAEGCVFDAVVDLRKNSETYGKYETFELDAKKGIVLYMPPGMAHGFYVLSERAIMVYKASTAYSPEHDTGILWNSIGVLWPDDNPIISERDSQFIEFRQLKSPFK